MHIRSIFFPEQSRTFPGKRWVTVFFRSFHLCFAGVYAGGLFFEINSTYLLPWLLLAGVSGALMMGIDIVCNSKWLMQNRGFFILLKALLLALLYHTGNLTGWTILIITFFSGITSHAPARFRYYSILHGKEI